MCQVGLTDVGGDCLFSLLTFLWQSLRNCVPRQPLTLALAVVVLPELPSGCRVQSLSDGAGTGRPCAH